MWQFPTNYLSFLMSETYIKTYILYYSYVYIFLFLKHYLFINNCHANISHLFTSYYLLLYVAVWETKTTFMYSFTWHTILFYSKLHLACELLKRKKTLWEKRNDSSYTTAPSQPLKNTQLSLSLSLCNHLC